MLKRLALVALVAAAAPSHAHVFVHGVSDDDFWIPHTLDPTGADATPGVLPEALDAIFGGADFRWRAVVYPTLAEARADFDRGGPLNFQVTSLSWVEQPVVDDTVFSAAFYVTADRLFFATGAPVATPECDAMGGLSLWGVVGYRYPCTPQVKIQRASGENALVRGLASGAFPAAIIEETTARFWARRQGVSLNIGPVFDMAELRLRLRAPPPGALERINASIARALRYGVIDEMRQRYIGRASGVGLP